MVTACLVNRVSKKVLILAIEKKSAGFTYSLTMELESLRLVFSKYTEHQFPDYYTLAGDERVMKMITGKGLTEAEATARYQKLLEANKQHPYFGFFNALAKDGLQMIGLGKLTLTKEGEAEVGYMLLPAYWGKGYGTEISDCLIQYARTHQELHTLMAVIDPANAASKRILEKAGFTLSDVCDVNGLPAEIYRLAIK